MTRAALPIKIDARRCRHSRFMEHTLAELHRVIRQPTDVCIHIERTVGREIVAKANAGQFFRKHGAATRVTRLHDLEFFNSIEGSFSGHLTDRGRGNCETLGKTLDRRH